MVFIQDVLMWSPSRVHGPFLIYRQVETSSGDGKACSKNVSSIPGIEPTVTQRALKPGTSTVNGGFVKRTITLKGSDGKTYRVISYYVTSDVLAMNNKETQDSINDNAPARNYFVRPSLDPNLKDLAQSLVLAADTRKSLRQVKARSVVVVPGNMRVSCRAGLEYATMAPFPGNAVYAQYPRQSTPRQVMLQVPPQTRQQQQQQQQQQPHHHQQHHQQHHHHQFEQSHEHYWTALVQSSGSLCPTQEPRFQHYQQQRAIPYAAHQQQYPQQYHHQYQQQQQQYQQQYHQQYHQQYQDQHQHPHQMMPVALVPGQPPVPAAAPAHSPTALANRVKFPLRGG
ncbi:hypothetical protein HDU84_004777 [Entophlyctis sp. JEL0112]|nr:hypothetical protein HDU84_004777 [Entophlyctis sp. JEL0112]